MEEEDMPTSNPLPPPPRPGGQKREKEKPSFSNLSNVDFRKMVLQTPRRDEQRRDRDKHRSKTRRPSDGGEGGGGEGEQQKGVRKHKGKSKEGEKADDAEEEDKPSYRDRAEERRKDVNPDYATTEQELGSLNAVGPPGTTELLTGEAHRISIEASKFLGGDLEHTHLVKGLDFALLQKVRSELQHKQGQEEQEDDDRARARREEKSMHFRTAIAKTVYQQLVRPPIISRVNEMFLPGRTQFVFDMEEFSHEIPTTVQRSKDDCPTPEETVTVAVDGTVLERISRIMAYLRLGSSGKALKKKKKERENGKVLVPGVVPLAAEEPHVEEEEPKAEQKGNGSARQGSHNGKLPEVLPPPPPMPRPRNEDDDIFVGAGVDYSVAVEKRGEKAQAQARPQEGDMEEAPRQRQAGGRKQYFEQSSGLEEAPPLPSLGPGMPSLPPPPPPPQDWQGGYPPSGPAPGPSYPPQGGWQAYPEAPPEHYGVDQWSAQGTEQYPQTDQQYPDRYPGQHPDQYSGQYPVQFPHGYPEPGSEWYNSANPPPPPPPGEAVGVEGLPPPPPGDPYPLGDERTAGDNKILSQEEKDRGLGSVFKRDDHRLGGKRETDPRERDPTFISESYSECYPDYTGFTREIVESDEEEDLAKMDQGAKAKGRLHQWDFETEEDWTKYNETKEAMPKAAYQFGVKAADGRKTRKSGKEKEQKLNRELHQITKIMDRRKKERGGHDEDEDEDDNPGKRPRL